MPVANFSGIAAARGDGRARAAFDVVLPPRPARTMVCNYYTRYNKYQMNEDFKLKVNLAGTDEVRIIPFRPSRRSNVLSELQQVICSRFRQNGPLLISYLDDEGCSVEIESVEKWETIAEKSRKLGQTDTMSLKLQVFMITLVLL